MKFAQEGANVAINYVTNRQRAEAVAKKIEREYGGKVALIQGVSELFRVSSTCGELTVQ